MSIVIPSKPDRPQPIIYNLATDYARFGLVPWQKDEILASKFTKRSGAKPEFIVLHVQDGTSPGSLGYWTTSGIDASSTVMFNKDGSILQIIPEADGPWTNGDVIGPLAPANEILALGGNPNIWSLTGEREGHPGDVIPKAQMDAMVWQVETWIIKYPNILNNHVWSILRHRHINSSSRWRCPDEGDDTAGTGEEYSPVVKAINVWLDAAVQPAEPPTPAPTPGPTVTVYPKGMTEELARELYGEVWVKWSSKPFTYSEHRSECRYWLERGKLQIKDGGDYTDADWPALKSVIRRGNHKVRVFRWDDGDVYEQVVNSGE